MTYIFMDESGDLGFDFSKSRVSKYFLITFLITDNPHELERVIKKTTSELAKKGITSNMLHAHKESNKVRIKLLSRLAEKDIKIAYIYVEKEKISQKSRTDIEIIYNKMTTLLLEKMINEDEISDKTTINFIASRKSTKPQLNENFTKFLKNSLKNKIYINIEIKTPQNEKVLQLVDFVSWSIFRKYEYKNEEFYQIIEDKIIEKYKVKL